MPGPQDLLRAARRATAGLGPDQIASLLGQPVIIMSAPRAGSNLLFEQLCRLPDMWSIGGESHIVFAAFPHLARENAASDSGALDASHADAETADGFRRCLLFLLRDRAGRPWGSLPAAERPLPPVWVEKTPRNALNAAFLLALFPGAQFVYLHREPRANIASLIDAWQHGLETGRFVTYADLPGWSLKRWCFLLPRGWRELDGEPLAAIASFQWAASNRQILDALSGLPDDRRQVISYESLLESPTDAIARVAEFAGLHRQSVTEIAQLPLSKTALTPPDPDKWRRHADAIDRESSRWQEVASAIKSF